MTLPDTVRGYLSDPTLAPVWDAVRRSMERHGLRTDGTVGVELSPSGAERLSGILGRTVPAGRRRVSLAELDSALRSSAAAASLPTVIAALSGPLRDRRAERAAVDATWSAIWASLDSALSGARLIDAEWVPQWIGWLKAGICRRAGEDTCRATLPAAVAVIAELLTTGKVEQLGTLAARHTGSAHGLDDGTLASTVVLRALSAITGQEPAAAAAQRRQLWASFGVATDLVSGTVITYGLRPMGDDQWSQQLRSRADVGLVTHLTARELVAAPLDITGAVFGTENPQVLQAAADAEVPAAIICFAGEPSLAGSLLLRAVGPALRYHGDFDWPGVAIAGRVFASGASPWRFGADDYVAAVESCVVPLPLAGTEQATPWDPALSRAMRQRGVAIHEESILDRLLADLR